MRNLLIAALAALCLGAYNAPASKPAPPAVAVAEEDLLAPATYYWKGERTMSDEIKARLAAAERASSAALDVDWPTNTDYDYL